MVQHFIQPVQARSRKSFEKMVSAGAELIRRSPDGSFSIQELAKLSGTSVGAIYQRFGNKETASVVIHSAILDRMDEEAAALFAPGDALTPEQAVEEAVRRFCQHTSTHRDVLRGMVMQGEALPESRARGLESSRGIGQLFHGFLAHYLGPDPARHEMVFRMVYGLVWRQIFEDEGNEYVVPLTAEAVIAETAEMARRYLLDGPGAR